MLMNAQCCGLVPRSLLIGHQLSLPSRLIKCVLSDDQSCMNTDVSSVAVPPQDEGSTASASCDLEQA